jgi:thiosulfate/3-mercaptopyruvate sulfurtransferase
VTSPFISAASLAAAMVSGRAPVILDASLVLHRPTIDGEHRSESGYPLWAAAHVPGSRHVDIAARFTDAASPLHFTHPSPQAVADEAARLGIARHSTVVVYDSTGTLWAARLWYLLSWIGLDVRVLDGGIAAWRAAGNAVESTEGGLVPGGDVPEAEAPRVAAPRWEADVRRDFWVGLSELSGLTSMGHTLVCGLSADSFAGVVPTRYARRGHIPGSVNVPYAGHFAPDGTVRSRAAIALSYAEAGVDVAGGAEILLYCGGGIAASANALALAEAGMYAVRIYDGSLEEWTADPYRRTVTG